MPDEPQTQTESQTVTIGTDDIATIRDLVLRAHPNVVPELVRGVTVAELTASIPDAEAAYQRIASALTGQGSAQEPASQPGAPASAAPADPVVPVNVPAGGGVAVIDFAKIPAAEKIRRGLEQMKRDAARP